MDKKSVQVQIGGIDYSLKSDDGPDYVEALARFVDEKLRKLSGSTKVKSQTKLAVLTALNIADEYFQLSEENKRLTLQLERFETKAKDICDDIDRQLKEVSEV